MPLNERRARRRPRLPAEVSGLEQLLALSTLQLRNEDIILSGSGICELIMLTRSRWQTGANAG